MLDEGVLITYHGVLPVLVVMGAVGSVATIWVLRRPAIKKASANRYFLLLAVYDLALCLCYIPVVVTASGCSLPNYGSAFYFAHFGWTTACTFHALGTYVIVFLSLDRFVGVWFPTWFKRLQQPPFGFWHRMTAAAGLCLGLHVPYMVDADVQCCRWEEGQPQSFLQCKSSFDSCHYGTLFSIDGFEYSFSKAWHTVYRYVYNLVVRWAPSVLLLVFNLSLVVAVGLGRVMFPKSPPREKVPGTTEDGMLRKRSRQITRNSERILVATVIAMTAGYVLLTLPITIFLTVFANTGTQRCVSSSPEETLRHVGNVLQLLEHVIHTVFLLFINPRFRREMLHLLKCPEASGGEGDTTTPEDLRASSHRPFSGASCSFSTARGRDSLANKPLSGQPPHSDNTSQSQPHPRGGS